MSKPKIDPDELISLIASGMTQSEAARHFGVSNAAISLRAKQLRLSTSRVIALERAAAVVDQKLSAADRLAEIQRVMRDQLAWAEDQARQPGADRSALVDVIIRVAAEMRNQLRLEHDISRTLIDLKVVREFQRTVFEAIAEESPDTARRIVDRLKRQQALRQSVEIPALDGGRVMGGFDVA
jgi:hypothetical protein